MEDFKDLLNLTPIEYKNIVKIDATWDYYNDDYDECHATFNADEFFKDKKIDMVACLFGEIRARG